MSVGLSSMKRRCGSLIGLQGKIKHHMTGRFPGLVAGSRKSLKISQLYQAMETKQITVRVNLEAAHIFEAASEEQRRKIEALLSLKLTQATRKKRALEEVMDDISQKAQERGLTPEILDAILNEP